jgi:hypothetical protein
MKTLMDDITGRKDLPIFKGSNEDICKWVNLNIDSIDCLNEPSSCDAYIDGESIFISGDEDYKQFNIIEVDFIKV